MQFKSTVICAAVLACTSAVNAASVTLFAGASCTGSTEGTFSVPSGECLSFGSGSVKSISYSGVPKSIAFYVSGGGHDSCTNGSSLTRGAGSGCATAPAG